MVDILKDIQQKYVPVDHQDDKVVLQQTVFAWDQLTAARAQKSQTVRQLQISYWCCPWSNAFGSWLGC